MPIPTARTLGHQILREISDGAVHKLVDIQLRLLHEFSITKEEEAQKLPSGSETIFSNRLRNASYQLRKQELASFSSPGTVQITAKGDAFLQTATFVVHYTTTTAVQPLHSAPSE